jgi:hypothetical protein
MGKSEPLLRRKILFQSLIHHSTYPQAQIVLSEPFQSILNSVLNVLQIILTFGVAYLVVLWLTLCFWTFRDIQARTRDIFAIISAPLLVLFFNIPGIFIYRLVRPKETLAEAYESSLQEEYMLQDLEERDICPVCRVKVQPEFNFCFNCRTRLRRECGACGYSIKMKWTNCPNCGTPAKTRGRETVAPGLGTGRNVTPASNTPRYPAAPNTERAIIPTSEDNGSYQNPTSAAVPTYQPQGPNRAPRPRPTGTLRQRLTAESEGADAGVNPNLAEQTETTNYYPAQPNNTENSANHRPNRTGPLNSNPTPNTSDQE